MEYLASTPAQLSAILKSTRKRNGVTQALAGKGVGLKQGTVSVVESDAARTSVETLYKLLSALNLELVIRDKGAALAADQQSAGREW